MNDTGWMGALCENRILASYPSRRRSDSLPGKWSTFLAFLFSVRSRAIFPSLIDQSEPKLMKTARRKSKNLKHQKKNLRRRKWLSRRTHQKLLQNPSKPRLPIIIFIRLRKFVFQFQTIFENCQDRDRISSLLRGHRDDWEASKAKWIDSHRWSWGERLEWFIGRKVGGWLHHFCFPSSQI